MNEFLIGFICGAVMILLITFIVKYISLKYKKETVTLLDPLKEKIDLYQSMLLDQRERSIKQEENLKVQIEHMLKSTFKVEEETSGIIKALKGDSKLQGDWGEVLLERSLEISGLVKGKEFILQGESLDLKDDEGRHQKPDAVILLPENKTIVIDSKVSLKSVFKEDKESLRKSLKSHIDDLSSKRYQLNEKLNPPDFVIMFIPMENLISEIFKDHADLFDHAYKKGIILCGPLSIIPIIRTVSSLWRVSNQNKNAEEIARQAGLLYDKFTSFVNDMDKLKKSISKISDDFETLDKRLHLGKDSLVDRSEKLKELGAKTSK